MPFASISIINKTAFFSKGQLDPERKYLNKWEMYKVLREERMLKQNEERMLAEISKDLSCLLEDDESKESEV
jgi:hypothetical protein